MNENTILGLLFLALIHTLPVSEPTKFFITVNSGKYYINGFLTPDIVLDSGTTYEFVQSDKSNSMHPLELAAAQDSLYLDGYSYLGTAGIDGIATFNPSSQVPRKLYYYCQNHPDMGDQGSITITHLSINSYLSTPIVNHESPGLFAAIIDKNGVSAIASAGVRKQNSSELLTINDLVHLGSCTKSMTSTMLATLVANGTFTNGWDTTIIDVFPELNARIHHDYQSVTLWQLVSHLGGIAENAKDWWIHQNLEIINRRYQIIIENLNNAPVGPVGKYVYSNLGFVVAAAMAEKITSKSWETLMQEQLFIPLEMSTAGFGIPGTINEVDQPWGHYLSDESAEWIPVQSDNAAALGPAGTIHCSIPDWAKFIQLQFLNKTPAILDREKLNDLITPKVGNYAAGWYVLNRNWAEGKVLNHSGSNTTNFVNLWVDTERGHAFIAGANSASKNTFQILDSIISNLINHHNLPDE